MTNSKAFGGFVVSRLSASLSIMSDQVSLLGSQIPIWQLGFFVAGIAVGASSAWLLGKQSPKTTPVAPTPQDLPAPAAKKDETLEEEEELEEDEEWDSDDELLEGDEQDPENVPHKMVRFR